MESLFQYDVIIIGGGPAGLSAALILGRCRRNVLLCDNNGQRNKNTKQMHGYLTRDGINPHDFLKLGNEELDLYNIKRALTTIIEISPLGKGFQVKSETGELMTSRKILLATGLIDILPDVPSIMEYYGKSIFHCPYCDGWEFRDKAIGVYSRGGPYNLALSMKTWSKDVVLLTDGITNISAKWRQRLAGASVRTYSSKIKELIGENGKLTEIKFIDETQVKRDVIFFNTGYKQNCDFAAQLGCMLSKKGTVLFNKKQQTNIKGIFVAGDTSMDMKFVIVAAAEGAKAGVAINIALQEEENSDNIE